MTSMWCPLVLCLLAFTQPASANEDLSTCDVEGGPGNGDACVSLIQKDVKIKAKSGAVKVKQHRGQAKKRVERAPTQEEQQQFVAAINKYRCMHGVADVVWSQAVAASANTYISPLTSMQHSSSYSIPAPAGPAGENIFQIWGSPPTAQGAVDAWYEEVNNCRGGPTAFSDGCADGNGMTGHFTAMVWKGVTSIGCAFSNSGGLVLCRFKAGDTLSEDTPNMNKGAGAYVQHVLPRTRSAAQCGGSGGGSSPAHTRPAQPPPSRAQPAASQGGGDTCKYANDGECDEPAYCTAGTDSTDCQTGGSTSVTSDTCTYANDGECDEPNYCDAGTDCTDCKAC